MSDEPKTHDVDPLETREWVDALEAVIAHDGPERAHFLIAKLYEKARRTGIYLPYSAQTGYTNTIAPQNQLPRPGNAELEQRLENIIRWNAMATVVRANKDGSGLGGHIASYASAATIYEVCFNHFFHARSENHGGDLVYFQGHSAPGVYARAFLEGRVNEDQLVKFRREVDGQGLSSYPHSYLMPDFWQFATVSMGLGPLMAIYHARFMKYLTNRGLANTEGRKVYAFLGDGEMDEPESQGALAIAAREQLDNLVFVVNCNLQRLDGPVRGNGKIIQELEGSFRGAGWNVIKVIWGGDWDALLANDPDQLLQRRMEEAVDGEYQAYVTRGGAYMRENFFGKYPELAARVAHLSDDDLWRLKRGGHDPDKVYAAFAEANRHKGQPTLILVKSVKGFGMGDAGEGQNITHQQKKMDENALVTFKRRFNLPISDEEAVKAPFYKPADDSPELQYLRERRAELGGPIPARENTAEPLEVPALDAFSRLLESTGDREISTTMAFVRALTVLTRDKNVGPHIVPIVADEARTFGMEGMFRQLSIYAPSGQLYTPHDSDQLMFYKESADGQILQEGISEAGATSSWIASATSYVNHGVYTVPFFIFYSMFGFQRIADLLWAASDMGARGFMMGATAGRTTLNGEGLQHQDGHSHLMAATNPSCVAYDPTFGYELAVILQDGMRRMYAENEDVFYYITVMNENYAQPAMPEGAEEGIRKGMYLFRKSKSRSKKQRVQLLGSGTILREVIAAADLLEEDFGVAADIWSVTSFNELRREGLSVERRNMLQPDAEPQTSYVEHCLADTDGPVIAATDYMKSFADQIRPFVPRTYRVLGTDGFGRSDTREALRHFFEVDRHFVAVAALKSLADEGKIAAGKVREAIKKYGIDPNKPEPTTV